MKCSKCGEDTDKLYHQGDTHLCGLCLQTVTHIHYKPLLCRFCGAIISSPFSLLNPNDNARFCSLECMAKAVGFHVEESSTEKITVESSEQSTE